MISSDDLETESGEEEEVFRAVMRWAESTQAVGGNDAPTCSVSWVGPEFGGVRGPRCDSLHNVMSHVRLPRVSPYFLHDCVATQR